MAPHTLTHAGAGNNILYLPAWSRIPIRWSVPLTDSHAAPPSPLWLSLL
jgi:hypothetical protein